MRNIMFLIFLLAAGPVIAAQDIQDFSTLATELDREAAELSTLNDTARNCFPKMAGNTNTFCTGFSLGEAEATKLLALSGPDCQKAIVQRGYVVAVGQRPAKVSEQDYDAFFKSTKNAETFHAERVVMLKRGFDALTCVHELLHVYQRQPGLGALLAPNNREMRTQRIVELLNRVALLIEDKEKRGDVASAKQMMKRLEPVLAQMKLWSSLPDLLDEKDVHGWLWLRCRTGGAAYCSMKQLDVALANLWVRRDFIPKATLELIAKDGKKLISGQK
ncbi:MAG TPA: hypothetical protein VM901_01970 [Bdellovibrionota bacterium]|jgi:hypothetical protein|nr:hypothetical protein [Bdellovibrionota bacterium]